VRRSPLFALHMQGGASLAAHSDCMVPENYGIAEPDPLSIVSGAGVVDLSHIAVLDLQASDLRRWANGIFTNNIRRLPVGRGNRNGMCDDRGRLQGLLDLYCLADDHFLAVLDGVDADWFEARYRMFLILDDIEVEPQFDVSTLISLQGPTAGALLSAVNLPVPGVEREHLVDATTGVRVARRDRTGLGGFDLMVPLAGAIDLWAALRSAGARPFGLETLDALRVRAGQAAFPQDAGEKSMIHELRLNQEICAFDKGCYVGQEIINRIDVKGLLTKKLMGLVVEGEAPPIGAEVVVDDVVVGVVTSSAPRDGGGLGLSVVRKSAWTPGVVARLRTPDGERDATLSELPFGG
jgi:folate-binding protein YgfZ